MIRRLGLFLLLSLTLLACKSVQPPPSRDVPVAPGVTLTLPERPPFGAPVSATQLIQGTYGTRHQVFQVLIEANADHAEIVVTVPSGPRLMSIAWGPAGISSKIEPQVPDSMTAEHLLADMMLVYAPKAALEQAIAGGVLTVSPNGEARRIGKDGKELIAVTRPPEPMGNAWNGHAELKNLAYGYTLEIKSVSKTP